MIEAWEDTKDARIKRRGGVYWARFMKKGQLVVKSLKTKNFDLAKSQVENIESDILLGVNWKRADELFATAWPDFLIDKAAGVKTKVARKKTLKEYIAFGERFYLPAFGALRLSQIDEESWREFVLKVQREKPTMQFDNVRKYLMGFLSWAYRKGKLRTKPELFDPDVARKEAREVDGPGLAYTLEQLREMRRLAKAMSERFYLFVLMAQYMGMRPGEISQLSIDRIDLVDNVIRLRKIDTKTAQSRVVPIAKEVRALLVEHMGHAKASDYLFWNRNDHSRPMDPQGFKKYWQTITEALGVEGRVYDFRHTFITHAIASGLNPAVVGKMTGTSLSMIEKRYLHLTTESLHSEMKRLSL